MFRKLRKFIILNLRCPPDVSVFRDVTGENVPTYSCILFRAFSAAIKVHIQTLSRKGCKDGRERCWLERERNFWREDFRFRAWKVLLYPWISHREISISAFLSTIPRSRTDYPLIRTMPTGWRIRPIFLLLPISSIISVSFQALEKLTCQIGSYPKGYSSVKSPHFWRRLQSNFNPNLSFS